MVRVLLLLLLLEPITIVIVVRHHPVPRRLRRCRPPTAAPLRRSLARRRSALRVIVPLLLLELVAIAILIRHHPARRFRCRPPPSPHSPLTRLRRLTTSRVIVPLLLPAPLVATQLRPTCLLCTYKTILRTNLLTSHQSQNTKTKPLIYSVLMLINAIGAIGFKNTS